VSDLPDRRPPDASAPARRFGAPAAAGIPRMETVRITAPDLERRAAIARSHRRLLVASGAFVVLFLAVAAKLTDATVLQPMLPRESLVTTNVPKLPVQQAVFAATPAAMPMLGHAHRAPITDRNGEILAISLPMATAYADPRQVTDPEHAAEELATVLPDLDVKVIAARLASDKKFIYIARDITPEQELRINDLGIPGVAFQETEVRRYPLGVVAAQTIGHIDRAGHGDMGLEKYFDKRLDTDPTPLRLSIDVRIQAVVRDVLAQAVDEFHPLAAAGIVMNVQTGEVLAIVSLPDYDANDFDHSTADERFNRPVQGVYEPGSTFKLQTASMALDAGIIHPWDEFDAAHPIHVGRFTITDFEGKHRWLYLPEVLVYSSNLGAAHIAMAVGAERQRAWLQKMGMFNRVPIQLPEAARPLFQPAKRWGESTVMTVGFGQGISEPPVQIVRATAAVANGGILRPATLLAVAPDTPVPGVQVMKPETSDLMRKLMRLVVSVGYGKPADIPGYFVGGKTGTSEKVGAHGYRKHTNVSAFVSVFPMNAPKYAVYMMLDAPQGNKSTGGFSTAGAVSAPAAGKVIARIGPMLGLLPATGEEAQTIAASLAFPLQPQRPVGVAADVLPGQGVQPIPTNINPTRQPQRARPRPDQRRADAGLRVQAVALR
jgi:cell division protein FtsI (penicillin-binding protein 3)